jgi:tRNA nucleotidyltransferase/poly(A) polymerase
MIITKYNKFLESKSDMWNIIPQSVKDLHQLFKQHHKKLFVVGGAVRDFLNNERPKDFDLCTDATPDEVLEIVGKKYRNNLQGKAFGVVVVYTEDEPKGMEIATFREDQYDDKLGITRNPDVKFSTIEKDVERRDIPYNALFFDLDKKEIVDLVGGVKDLENKVTRFVGDPELRIQEDPLRILRLIRFNCRYRFNIDEKTAEAIEENKDRLSIITKERIWAFSGDNAGEIMKAWKQAKSFTEYLNLLTKFGLWKEILPGFKINTDIKDSKYLEVYLANLLKENKNVLDKLVQDCKIEVDMARKIVFLISLLDFKVDDVTEMYKKRTVARVNDEVILDWYKINQINDATHLAFIKYKPSVSAQDLMDKGFKGAELGKEIKRLEIEKFKEII